MSADPKHDVLPEDAPLSDVTDSELNRLVDDVLRSGKHFTIPASGDATEADASERLHARAIADQMQRLAHQLSAPRQDEAEGAVEDGPDDIDEWWFEVDGSRLGPISLRKARYLWESGELSPDSLCWHQGFTSWVSLFRVSELAEALAPRPAADVRAITPPPRPATDTSTSGSWKPIAAASLESANRLRLAATQPHLLDKPVPAPSPAANDDAPSDAATSTIAGTFATLPVATASAPQVTAPPAARRGGFSHAMLSGLVAGLVIAAAVVGARMLWPTTSPQPIVVVVRDEAKSQQTQVAEPSTPAPAKAKAKPSDKPKPEPKPEQPRVAAKAEAPTPAPMKVTPKPEPRPEPAARAPEAQIAPASGSKGSESVDEAFAREFTPPPDELETSEIFEVVAEHRAEVDACVQAQKASTPDLSGRLVMRWKVDLEGRVSDVKPRPGAHEELELVGCLQKAIGTWTFSKHEVPHGPVEVPFVF